MIDALSSLGLSAVEWLWLPLAAWTVLWLVAEAVLRISSGVHPLVRYRAVQALMLCLPLGIATGGLVDLSVLLPAGAGIALLPEIVVAPLSFQAPAVESPSIEVVSSASSTLSVGSVVGLSFLFAAVLSTVQLVRLVVHWLALVRLRRGLRSAPVVHLDDDAVSIAARLGVKRPVKIIADDIVGVPMTFGWVRPLIVLPAGLDAEQRRLALLHEMVHVRQNDYLAQWLEATIAAVFTFHPGIHRLRRKSDLLREQTCDAALLQEATVNRRAYAALVFSFVSPPARMTPVTVGMADRRSHIHQRFEAMKSLNPTSIAPSRLAWTAALTVLLCGSLVLSASHALAQVEEPERVPLRLFQVFESTDSPLIFIDDRRANAEMLEALSPDDIHTIHILKDESAIERFGVEGANGVISIITNQHEMTNAARERMAAERQALEAHWETLRQSGDEGALRPPTPPDPPGIDLDGVFVIVEEMPSPIGGLEAIHRRVRYPELARRAGIEGTVFVQFIVNEDGSIADAVCIRDIGAGTCEAAIAGIEQTSFTPGYQAGEPVRVRFSMPVRFNLATSARDAAAAEGQATVTAPREATGDTHLQMQSDGAAPEFGTHGVFPNPTQDVVAIAFSLPDAAEMRVELYDMAGRRVFSSAQSFPAGARHTFQVPTEGLAAGTYAYRLYAAMPSGTETVSGTLTVAR